MKDKIFVTIYSSEIYKPRRHGELRKNPKFEYRNSKQIQNSNVQNSKLWIPRFGHSCLFRISDFVLRIFFIIISLFIWTSAFAQDSRGNLEYEYRWLSDQNPDEYLLRFRSAIQSSLMEEPSLGFFVKMFGAYYSAPTSKSADGKIDHDTFRPDELYIDWESKENVYLIMGKKRLGWGPGFLFNPSNFIDPPKDARDPEINEEGSWQVLAEYLKTPWTTTILLLQDSDHFYYPGRSATGGRIQLLIPGFDISVYGLAGKTRAYLIGTSFTSCHLNGLGMYGEYAYSNETTQAMSQSSDNDWHRILLGGRYYFKGQHNISLEWYHNNGGMGQREREEALSSPPKTSRIIGELNRNYLNLNLFLLDIANRYNIEGRLLVPEDKSFLLTTDLSMHLTDQWTLRPQWQYTSGESLTEFGSFPFKHSLAMQVNFNF